MKKLIIITSLLTIFVSQISFASPGRTDKSGCHTSKKTGKHHCHKKD
jgi:hypothetical protein